LSFLDKNIGAAFRTGVDFMHVQLLPAADLGLTSIVLCFFAIFGLAVAVLFFIARPKEDRLPEDEAARRKRMFVEIASNPALQAPTEPTNY
jgi:hypothetical protein